MSVGPGEMLGWSSFVEQRNYAINGHGCRTNATCPNRRKAAYGQFVTDDPEFGYDFMHRIMRALAKRLTTTWSQLANVYLPTNLPMKAGIDE